MTNAPFRYMKKIIAGLLTFGFCASVLSGCIVEERGYRRGGYSHRDHGGYHRGY